MQNIARKAEANLISPAFRRFCLEVSTFCFAGFERLNAFNGFFVEFNRDEQPPRELSKSSRTSVRLFSSTLFWRSFSFTPPKPNPAPPPLLSPLGGLVSTLPPDNPAAPTGKKTKYCRNPTRAPLRHSCAGITTRMTDQHRGPKKPYRAPQPSAPNTRIRFRGPRTSTLRASLNYKRGFAP